MLLGKTKQIRKRIAWLFWREKKYFEAFFILSIKKNLFHKKSLPNQMQRAFARKIKSLCVGLIPLGLETLWRRGKRGGGPEMEETIAGDPDCNIRTKERRCLSAVNLLLFGCRKLSPILILLSRIFSAEFSLPFFLGKNVLFCRKEKCMRNKGPLASPQLNRS